MIWIILLEILIFSLLVFVHELGHFISARRGGIDVEEFGFGFPPRVWGKKVGKTIYSINLLPLGGFVRMKGESSSDTRPGTFGGAPFKTKARVMLAGVTMNLIAAYMILLYLALSGMPPIVRNQFTFGPSSYAQQKALMAVVVEKGSPADQAGLKSGDIIDSLGGQAFSQEEQLVNYTKVHAGETEKLVWSHHGITKQAEVTLRPPGSQNGYLGVSPLATYLLRYTWSAPIVAAGILGQIVWATLVGIGMFFYHLPTLVTSLWQPPTGQPAQVTGVVGIFDLLSNLTHFGAPYILLLVMAISVSLAVFNLLPIPILDGGRFMIVALQRLFRRQLAERTEMMIYLVSYALMALLIVVVTALDLKNRTG